ncbi:Rieske (2Fe-2S) protein [Rhizobium sp. BK602]|uniref:Rieske (2Fe-2S) protein n=1 Tax=Rhizobium sp. BK602 TaxID=2586986 RepID=UPI001617644F|nr:Rieske (2Fe-2S) protein [Rhizobium sp. BK602]MBB3609437.1 nitrite reductase/ring-hydroxylating ferredoxin subunit [Rhizobium sp. BK602]
MTLEAGWVPVALSASIEPGTSAGAVVDGKEIVVWRDNSGKAHVWEDRCPHRGMRMSFGFVRGDHIACLYHGWQYDTAGQCRYIPAHPTLEVPQTIKVPTCSAEEKYGIVWATASTEASLPDINAAADVAPVRSLYVECGAGDVIAALKTIGMGDLNGNLGLLALGEDQLLLAVQEISTAKTAIHIVLLVQSVSDGGGKRKQYAQWAARLRFDLEQMAEVA